MRAAIIVFPGSNCDRDIYDAMIMVCGITPLMVWHAETSLPDNTDLVILPGGFSYGDYLRPGAMAGHSSIIPAIRQHANAGGYIIGICNGFQILTETGLLPGALIRNAGLRFVCRQQLLHVAPVSIFTEAYAEKTMVQIPVAHSDGNFYADTKTLDLLEAENRIAFRYHDNPNGSARDIAGIVSANRRILGMMPHPERAVDPALDGSGGTPLFAGLVASERRQDLGNGTEFGVKTAF